MAGVNTRPLMRAADPMVGIAGNWGSTLRPHVERVVAPGPGISQQRLGDHATLHAWRHACYFLDDTDATCPGRQMGRMGYRPGFRELCAPETRRLPLFLDSAAFREFTGGAPAWSSYDRYREAIELMRPDGVMAKDVVGNQRASLEGYERMSADGFAAITIPIWQVMPAWVSGLSVEANARLASRDPVLRFSCDRSPLVALGGLSQSPCRRSERHRYLEVLCHAFPNTQFWALGQANPVVVNGLGCAGLLHRVFVDGSWWIHDAQAEVLAVLEDGLIKTIRLTRTGARSFFPLLSAYAGLWTFPGPPRCRPTWRTWTPGSSCGAASPRRSSTSLDRGRSPDGADAHERRSGPQPPHGSGEHGGRGPHGRTPVALRLSGRAAEPAGDPSGRPLDGWAAMRQDPP